MDSSKLVYSRTLPQMDIFPSEITGYRWGITPGVLE
jgi:hypothetical protein